MYITRALRAVWTVWAVRVTGIMIGHVHLGVYFSRRLCAEEYYAVCTSMCYIAIAAAMQSQTQPARLRLFALVEPPGGQG